jgi:hypothetical protein
MISFHFDFSVAISHSMIWYAPIIIKITAIPQAIPIAKLIAPFIISGTEFISKFQFLKSDSVNLSQTTVLRAACVGKIRKQYTIANIIVF